jgi:hypothetical protein
MRKFIACLAVAAVAAPAFAQQPVASGAPPSDTLAAVTTKGIILQVEGMDIPVKYTPDGKFDAMEGQFTGTWRVDGETLCTTADLAPGQEDCVKYPVGKKSGDSFEVTGSMGTATIKIN